MKAPKEVRPYFALVVDIELLTNKWHREDDELAIARSGLAPEDRDTLQETHEMIRVNCIRETAIKELLVKHFPPRTPELTILVLP